MILLGFVSVQANIHFDASCMNLRREKGNTTVYLNLQPSLFHIDAATGELTAELLLRIGFYSQPGHRLVYESLNKMRLHHDFLSGKDPFSHQFPFDIPSGEYEVTIEVEDRLSRKIHWDCLDFVSRDLNSAIAISDLLLVQEYGGVLSSQPLLSGHIRAVPERLSLSAEIYLEKPALLTARVILYKRQTWQLAARTDADRMQSSQYVTINQTNSVVDGRKSSLRLNETLDLTELPHGEYLLEVYLFDDDKLVAEADRSFVIEWKHLKDVFSNLDKSADMMVWVAPPSVIEALKQIDDADEQQFEFLNFWEKRADPIRETATDAIERYYSRVFYASENFEEVIPGWMTDRGKTYTLYGAPDHQNSINIGGSHFEAWTYSNWGIKFLFKNEKNQMRLILTA